MKTHEGSMGQIWESRSRSGDEYVCMSSTVCQNTNDDNNSDNTGRPHP